MPQYQLTLLDKSGDRIPGARYMASFGDGEQPTQGTEVNLPIGRFWVWEIRQTAAPVGELISATDLAGELVCRPIAPSPS